MSSPADFCDATSSESHFKEDSEINGKECFDFETNILLLWCSAKKLIFSCFCSISSLVCWMNLPVNNAEFALFFFITVFSTRTLNIGFMEGEFLPLLSFFFCGLFWFKGLTWFSGGLSGLLYLGLFLSEILGVFLGLLSPFGLPLCFSLGEEFLISCSSKAKVLFFLNRSRDFTSFLASIVKIAWSVDVLWRDKSLFGCLWLVFSIKNTFIKWVLHHLHTGFNVF